jgi:hypothetical protein
MHSSFTYYYPYQTHYMCYNNGLITIPFVGLHVAAFQEIKNSIVQNNFTETRGC